MHIKLKWNKKQFDDLEFEVSDGLMTLKSLIFSLTGVPVDRQKLLAKGKTLKDDGDLSSIVDGMQLMLMGTAEVLEAPKENITFLEDMTAEQKAEKNVTIPAGFVNLGNTCYMNSTLQCLRHMPELRTALQSIVPTSTARAPPTMFSVALRETWNGLDRAGKTYTPLQFVSILRSSFPQFAQQGPRGGYMQQDAEELYNIVTQSLDASLTETPTRFSSILGIDMEETLTCAETSAEPVITRTEKVSKLVCNIQGGPGSNVVVNHLAEGLKLGLEGTLEKHSSVLDRDAVWNKRQRVARLPKFLCIQYMRFFWKATPESRDHTGVKCKILRPVAFTETLDIFEFTSASLQSKLAANRAAELKLADLAVAAIKRPEDASTAPEEKKEPPADDASSKMDVDEDEAAMQAALALSMSGGGDGSTSTSTSTPAVAESAIAAAAAAAEDDGSLPCVGFTGLYELMGIVTHKGRSADSGHYIAWVRQQPGSEYWWKYDDEEVTEVQSAEILNLKGGGDWHTAYLSFYRYKSK